MIEPSRFIANKALDFEAWEEARRWGITATEVAKASTPAGWKEVVAGYSDPQPIPDNPYMEFGRRMEGPIALWVKEQTGVMPNEWLIAAELGENLELATPDGLSLEHRMIAEIKTTGRDFVRGIPVAYRRQVQWQLYVTGAEVCYFAWLLRVEAQDGSFTAGWIEPKMVELERDSEMIGELCQTAHDLWKVKRAALHENGGSNGQD